MQARDELPPTVLNMVVQEFDHAIPLLGVCAGHEDSNMAVSSLVQ